MSLMLRRRWAWSSILIVLLAFAAGTRTSGTSSPDPLTPSAAAQIQALMEEKKTRTPAQQKVDSNLLYEAKRRRGSPIAPGVPMLETGIEVGPAGEVVVDIAATVTDSLLDGLASLGGQVLDSYPAYHSIRAALPLDAVETLAEHPDVLFINRKQEAMLNRAEPAAAATRGVSAALLSSVQPGFAARAAEVRSQLAALLGRGKPGAEPAAINKMNTSQGVVTHRADLATFTFGATGTGVRVGVLSDGVNSLAALQASGDLPAVTVLPGQAGSGDEGSAMLEIVYDMAPGAQLYYATAFSSIASFAQNIHNLRTAGCDIIIDDVTWSPESPFQKGQTGGVGSTTNGGLITQAVNDVTAAGALYFSSSANSGSKNKNTSGTWEGDYVDGGPAGPPVFSGRLHNFGGFNYDTITAAPATGQRTILFWSDPLGGSGNDYDFFRLDSTGTVLHAASTNLQSGTQVPYEFIAGAPLGDRVVVLNYDGLALPRFLHVEAGRGQLSINTQGSTHGHNAPPGPNAFGVAATPATSPGPFPNPFNSSNHIETFSSDGPRHYFFNADSTAITPGNFLSGGGQIIQQPLITAADGVACAAPGFNPFYGTSAAAPHAGAIAALVKSAKPSLTASQISSVLTSAAIDIEGLGVDRDSGYGILDAFTAVQAVAVTPTTTPTPTRTPTPTTTPVVIPGIKGDFNGDGKTDILWRHTTGAISVWFMNGTTVAGGAGLPSVDPSWSIVGTADFNSDGKPDILWRHTSGATSVWFMNGTTVAGGAGLPSVDPSWSIAAAGDFNSDGKPDILWRHTSGATSVWFMNGTTVAGGAGLPSVDPSWSIAAAGDFNSDGKPDILWRHTSGATSVWFMNGTTVAGGAGLPSVDPSWSIAAAGDFNSDGKPDILWRHTSGAIAVWFMNGTTVAGGAGLPSVDPSWKIVGPR